MEQKQRPIGSVMVCIGKTKLDTVAMIPSRPNIGRKENNEKVYVQCVKGGGLFFSDLVVDVESTRLGLALELIHLHK